MFKNDYEKYVALIAFADAEMIRDILYTAMVNNSVSNEEYHELVIIAKQIEK